MRDNARYVDHEGGVGWSHFVVIVVWGSGGGITYVGGWGGWVGEPIFGIMFNILFNNVLFIYWWG